MLNGVLKLYHQIVFSSTHIVEKNQLLKSGELSRTLEYPKWRVNVGQHFNLLQFKIIQIQQYNNSDQCPAYLVLN